MLVIKSGVHAPIPEAPADAAPVTLQTPPPDPEGTPEAAIEVGPIATEADRMMQAVRAKRPPVPGSAPVSGTTSAQPAAPSNR
jgi:hypothetical protein